MRILFANGRQIYPLFQGGDGVSFYHLFTRLNEDNHQVLMVGKLDPPHLNVTSAEALEQLGSLRVIPKQKCKGVYSYFLNKSLECHLLEHCDFNKLLDEEIRLFCPDVILTQLDNSVDVVKMAHKHNKKVVHFIHDHDPLNYLTINKSELISHVIFNTQNTSAHFKRYLKCSSSVIYPPIKLDNYYSTTKERKFITMINPTISKGVRIVEKLLDRFPEELFLLVKGWRQPEFSGLIPFNVEVWDRQYDMKKVYSQTKLLLVPSQWEESFGRVIPEAGYNKIPIVASRIGGIPESVGLGGVLIDEFSDPERWFEAVKAILNSKEKMFSFGEAAYRQSLNFDFDKIYMELISVFSAVNCS